MSIFSSPRFLRNVLLADAASGVGSGVLQLGFTAALVPAMGLPQPLLTGTGWFLLAYAAAAAWTALRRPIPAGLVWLFIIGNLAWAVACVALLLGSQVEATSLGKGYLVVQALFVTVMAELQWFGLRRAPAASLGMA